MFLFCNRWWYKSFQAQIIDDSFLQRLLEWRSGGGSSPKRIAIQWTLSRERTDIPVTSITRFSVDDDDNTSSKVDSNTTRTSGHCRRDSQKVRENNGNTTASTIDITTTNRNIIAGDIAGTNSNATATIAGDVAVTNTNATTTTTVASDVAGTNTNATTTTTIASDVAGTNTTANTTSTAAPAPIPASATTNSTNNDNHDNTQIVTAQLIV